MGERAHEQTGRDWREVGDREFIWENFQDGDVQREHRKVANL